MVNTIPFIKLSALTRQIHNVVRNTFANARFWVVADISNCSYYEQKGYYYFDLVEKSESGNQLVARIQANAFADGTEKIRKFQNITGQKFQDGIHVLLQVSVEYHPVYGLKLVVLDIDSNYTIGFLEQQRQQTLELLLANCPEYIRKEGDHFITRNNSLPLPPVIQKIAVVSSHSSAGYQDFKHTLENNNFGYAYQVDSYYTMVQGELNADAVCKTFINVFNSGKNYDVVVLIRGGGAPTDFLIFDQYSLARVIAKFPIPVITGIGHQKNETIADLMAHTATKTPTKTAELIIAHNRLFEQKLTDLQNNMLIRTQQRLGKTNRDLASIHSKVVNTSRDLLNSGRDLLGSIRQQVSNNSGMLLQVQHRLLMRLTSSLVQKPTVMLVHRKGELANRVNMLNTARENFIKSKDRRLENYISLIRVMSPSQILKRGFAIVKYQGDIITDASEVEEGRDISIILSGTVIESTVISKKPFDGKEFDL